MDAAREQFRARGCEILVIAQAKPKTIALYQSRMKWAVPIVHDPERAAYKAFGLERAGLLSFFKPLVMAKFIRNMLRGYLATKTYAGEDQMQLGGGFILARDRKVVFSYPSADPADRPSAARLLAAIPSATPIPRETKPDSPHVDSSAAQG